MRTKPSKDVELAPRPAPDDVRSGGLAIAAACHDADA